jgi:uncharacterized membrane protein YhdT
MDARIQKTALSALQWTLGLTLLIEAALFAFAPASAHAFSRTGLPNWIRMVEAWGEMLTAFLFLIPGAVLVGGWGLIVFLTAAIMIHLLHGAYNVLPLFVYAAATLAVMMQHLKRA